MKTLVLGLMLTSASMASAQADSSCEDLKTNPEIYSCLNNYAKRQLIPGSKADQSFRTRIERLLQRYDLDLSQIKTKSLQDSFRIYVDQSSQLRSIDSSKLCFDFAGKWGQRARVQNIKMVKEQINEAATFLAEVHASSWGHQVSFLFPIREVSICSAKLNDDRAVSFEQRSLRIGLGRTPLKSGEILSAWNSGNPIRSSELSWASILPFADKVRMWMQKNDPEAILRDKIAENWVILNPTGSLRTTALYTLAEAIYKLRSALDERPENHLSLNQMKSLIEDALKGPGFSDADRERFQALSRNDRDLRGLYGLWQQKTFSPQNILLVLENAIGDQMRKDGNLHLTLRKINAGVTVVNDKNISVRLEQLMASALPVSNFDAAHAENANQVIEFKRSKTVVSKSGETTTETTSFTAKGLNPKDFSLNADEISSGVAIDLIDNVIVSVQVPNLSAETYRRVSLYQALREYVAAEPEELTSLP